MHYYESVWTVCSDKDQLDSIILENEAEFKTGEICDKSHIILCLVPKWWVVSLRAIHDSSSKDTGFNKKLREAFLLLVSSRSPGCVFSRSEFMAMGEKEQRS